MARNSLATEYLPVADATCIRNAHDILSECGTPHRQTQKKLRPHDAIWKGTEKSMEGRHGRIKRRFGADIDVGHAMDRHKNYGASHRLCDRSRTVRERLASRHADSRSIA